MEVGHLFHNTAPNFRTDDSVLCSHNKSSAEGTVLNYTWATPDFIFCLIGSLCSNKPFVPSVQNSKELIHCHESAIKQ